MRRGLLTTLTLVVAACAGGAPSGEPGPGPLPEAPYEVPTPQVIGVAPDRIAVGDTVQVFGMDFVPADKGDVRAKFSGYYSTAGGERKQYVADVPLKFVNPGVAEFVFGPKIMFSASGEELGSFSGTISVVNRGAPIQGAADAPLDEKGSNPFDTIMHVKPSVIFDQIRNVEPTARCQEVTAGTVPEQSIAIGFHVVGIGEASEDNPFIASVGFESPLVTATFVKDSLTWPLLAPPSGGDVVTTSAGNITISQTITIGNGVNIDPAHVSSGPKFNVSPPVMLNGQAKNSAMLFRLASGKIEGMDPKMARFSVAVSDSKGNTVTRVAPFKIQNFAEVKKPSAQKMVERFEATMVHGCITGSGAQGTQYSYTESSSESRQTNLGFSWDQSTQNNVGGQVGYAFASLSASGTWGATFGSQAGETRSSDSGSNLNISVQIFPGSVAASYRQAQQLETRADLIYHSECGVDMAVGQAVFTDWSWGFDVAMGPTCAPASKLPPAQKFE